VLRYQAGTNTSLSTTTFGSNSIAEIEYDTSGRLFALTSGGLFRRNTSGSVSTLGVTTVVANRGGDLSIRADGDLAISRDDTVNTGVAKYNYNGGNSYSYNGTRNYSGGDVLDAEWAPSGNPDLIYALTQGGIRSVNFTTGQVDAEPSIQGDVVDIYCQ